VAITRFDVAKGHWVLYTDRGSMDLDETDRVSICNKMLTAGCDAAIVYAARKTKRIVTQANRKNLTPAQLAEWNDAVDEYRSMKGPAQ
jgi:homoaconitase/3-isopropylmalate dehydratase large subunit